MKLVLKLSSVCALFALGACSSLETAPLLYSSKIVVGVAVSGGATDTAGASFNVGYQQVDVAYVPVAVAKPCQGTAVDCGGKGFQLKELNGESNFIETSDDGMDDEIQKAQDNLNNKKTDLKAKKQVLDSLEEKRKKEGANLVSDDQLQSARKEFQRAERAEKSAETALKKLKSPSQDSNKNRRTDAYSVFGSFDQVTKTEAGKTVEVGLSMGRVFSTGVASQQLAEGVKRSSCLVAATRLVQVAQTPGAGASAPNLSPEFLGDLVKLCGTEK